MPRTLRNFQTGDKLAELLHGGGRLAVIPGRGLVPRPGVAEVTVGPGATAPNSVGFDRSRTWAPAKSVTLTAKASAVRLKESPATRFAARLGLGRSAS